MADKMNESFAIDIENCLATLKAGGTILFPTDTVWGIGCDATNNIAVEKVLQIKQRSGAQGLIVLLADETALGRYVTVPDATTLQTIHQLQKPTTIIYEGGKNVAAGILPAANTLAIRIVKDDFCRQLINHFGKPVVSTSANIHGQPTPQCYNKVDPAVIRQVDYIVAYRQQEQTDAQPSTILKIKPDGSFETIRR